MNILNPKFRYTNAASTNIKATFARVRREQQEAKRLMDAKVTTLPHGKGKAK